MNDSPPIGLTFCNLLRVQLETLASKGFEWSITLGLFCNL